MAANNRVQQSRQLLLVAVEEFEKGLVVALQEEKVRENNGLEDWNEPSHDEYMEDQREDERAVMEETKVMNQWVPPDILEVSRSVRTIG